MGWFLGCGCSVDRPPIPAVPPPPSPAGWTLVWSDEFNGPDGSAPDLSKWTYDRGGKGWGNQELECYTNRLENAQIKGGHLVITAEQESVPLACSDGSRNSYTSARLKTQGLFTQAYGRFEARIKIPAGQGIWPAFWMLGDNISTAGWPTCGEIDIMENIGREPGTVHGSLHGPSATSGTSDATSVFTLAAGQALADDFHLYAVEWEPGECDFMWTPISTERSPRPHGPPAAAGFSITLSSSFWTWRWAARGRAHPITPQFFRNQCWSTMSGCTPSNDSAAERKKRWLECETS